MTIRESKLRDEVLKLKRVRKGLLVIWAIVTLLLLKGIYMGEIYHAVIFSSPNLGKAITMIVVIVICGVILYQFRKNIHTGIRKRYGELDEIKEKYAKSIDEKIKNSSAVELAKLYPGIREWHAEDILDILNFHPKRYSFGVFKELFRSRVYPEKFIQEIDLTSSAEDMRGIEETMELTYKSIMREELTKERGMIREFFLGSMELMETKEIMKLYLIVDISKVLEEKDCKDLNEKLIREMSMGDLSLAEISQYMHGYYNDNLHDGYNRVIGLVKNRFEKELPNINSINEFNKILAELHSGEYLERLTREKRGEYIESEKERKSCYF